MKPIRILSLFTFIILILPFFQTCSDKTIIENAMIKGSPSMHEIPLNDKHFDPNSDVERKKLVYNFLEAKDEMTLNGYEIAAMTFEDFNLPSFVFLISILINTLIVFYGFKMKVNQIILFCVANIFISIGWIILLYFASILKDIDQIKFGYYLFIGNLLFMIYFAKKLPTTHAKRSLPNS